MTPEEVRAEIERRKQRARDLKLPNTMGLLYRVYFNWVIRKNLKEDPELILPEIRQSLKLSNDAFDFRFNGSEYRLVYAAAKTEKDYWGDETRSGTISLQVNGETVFELWESSMYARNARTPAASKTEEGVTAFVDGPWVTEIAELMRQLDAHRQDIQKRKDVPKEAEQLKQEMKRFGL